MQQQQQQTIPKSLLMMGGRSIWLVELMELEGRLQLF